jgi:hypothetical protein
VLACYHVGNLLGSLLGELLYETFDCSLLSLFYLSFAFTTLGSLFLFVLPKPLRSTLPNVATADANSRLLSPTDDHSDINNNNNNNDNFKNNENNVQNENNDNENNSVINDTINDDKWTSRPQRTLGRAFCVELQTWLCSTRRWRDGASLLMRKPVIAMWFGWWLLIYA